MSRWYAIEVRTTVSVMMKASLGSVSFLIFIILVWVIAKVRYYMRVSEEQWRRVDKSRLVDWSDDND